MPEGEYPWKQMKQTEEKLVIIEANCLNGCDGKEPRVQVKNAGLDGARETSLTFH